MWLRSEELSLDIKKKGFIPQSLYSIALCWEIFCNMLWSKNVHRAVVLAIHNKIFFMCYVIRGFKDQSETSTTYISKRTNILKINI